MVNLDLLLIDDRPMTRVPNCGPGCQRMRGKTAATPLILQRSTLDSEIHSPLPSPEKRALHTECGGEMTDQDAQTLPFECQHCQRRFKRLEHVQRHERTHTKEAPYQYVMCRSYCTRDII